MGPELIVTTCSSTGATGRPARLTADSAQRKAPIEPESVVAVDSREASAFDWGSTAVVRSGLPGNG
jgi:hypothetical protein